VTTTTNAKSLVDEVGGGLVDSMSITKGHQDPHYIEAKPSFMSKTNKADLVVSVGLELEKAWLPLVVRGARNPEIQVGTNGYFELGPLVRVLEVSNKVSRDLGDIHPSGNPHVLLDPIRAGYLANKLAVRLGEIDPKNAATYLKNAKAFDGQMKQTVIRLGRQLSSLPSRKVISYHKTLIYFMDRFKIKNVDVIEPRPGVSPSGAHILKLSQKIADQKIPVILVEQYFDTLIPKKIQSQVSVRVAKVPVAVNPAAGIANLVALYDKIANTIKGH